MKLSKLAEILGVELPKLHFEIGLYKDAYSKALILEEENGGYRLTSSKDTGHWRLEELFKCDCPSNKFQELNDLEIPIEKIFELVDKVKLHNCICGDVPHSIDDCEQANKVIDAIIKELPACLKIEKEEEEK